jgi:hypothetical protein
VIILNDRNHEDIAEEKRLIVPRMAIPERNGIFKAIRHDKNNAVCRFTKWVMIGSLTALGFFDFYYHDPLTKVTTVHNAFIEKSLKSRYDPFGTMTPFILGTWAAWGNGTSNSWTVPTDWNNGNNFIDCIGGGGSGAGYYSWNMVAGGGGGYSRRNNAPMTRGGTVYNYCGQTAQDCWFRIDGVNDRPYSYANGPYATHGSSGYDGGSGTGGGGYYGDVQYSGGNGGAVYHDIGTGGPGGGGAAGPYGNGGSGSNCSGMVTGGGGGGGGGGTPVNSTQGGNNWLGYGGGAGGVYGGANPQNGTAGGGGGGYNDTEGPYTVGNGGQGIEYNNSSWGSGGGGAGMPGAGNAGGNGGAWGGGGGSGGYWYGNIYTSGSWALIVAYYVPSHSSFIPGPSFAGL